MGYAARAREARKHMTRTLVFSGETAQEQFDVAYLGFVLGQFYTLRGDNQSKGQSRDERRTDVAALKALKAVSVSNPSKPQFMVSADVAVEHRTVTVDGTVAIQQSELDRVVKYIERVPWASDKIELVEEVLDHLSALAKVE